MRDFALPASIIQALYYPYIIPIVSLYIPIIIPILSLHYPYIISILSLYSMTFAIFHPSSTLKKRCRKEIFN